MLLIFTLVTILPFLWMISSSFKGQEAIRTIPIRWIPEHPTLEGYERVFNMQGFSFIRSSLNSLVLAIACTFVAVTSATMAAFVFAKLPFKGSGKLFGIYLATMMIPGTVTMVPNYIILRVLGLLDTYTGLILPSLANAFGVFLMRQSMMSVNNAYMESAYIDGASLYQIFFRIMLPMVTPTLSTMILLSFMGSWNSYLWPLIVLTSTNKQTLQVVLGNMNGMYKNNEHVLMAGAVLTILPILFVYLVSQKYVDQGISIGGIK
jgi:multiple sugar transport system permease protein